MWDVGQLTQKTNSPKIQLTQVVTNSPKLFSQLTQIVIGFDRLAAKFS